ncbi:MAG: hypothetical protein B6D79_15060 [gamma proteobacterium symbiont of Ctena orbiculata]|nr:MAG: hypothetical protein B6D79_15060 [gamma proteobacterium symbiont of Ctena orbiculata]
MLNFELRSALCAGGLAPSPQSLSREGRGAFGGTNLSRQIPSPLAGEGQGEGEIKTVSNANTPIQN